VDLVDPPRKTATTRSYADTPLLAPSCYLRTPCTWTLNLFL
jgi:hypothetical protein